MPLPTTMLGALLFAAVGGGEPAPRPGWHSVAFVNDPLSHGTVGDALLSLNEAILLHNGQLPLALLSAAEQAQLSLIPGTGTTTDVTWIDIDGNNTPQITIQQDLAPVLDTSFGLLIKGFGDRPVLDFSGPGITRGLLAPTNALALQDLVLSGGPFGLDVQQTDASGQPGCTLWNVDFVGHAQFGLRVVATTGNGAGRLIVENCRFSNCPLAIAHDESPTGRVSICELHQVDVTGAQTGFDATLGAGGSTRYTFDRVTIAASVRGIRIARGPNANRQTFLEGRFVRVRAPECADLQCHASGLTWAVLDLWDLRAPSGGTALRLGAPGTAWFGELAELTLDGAATIAAGAGPQPVTVSNLRASHGPLVLATSATQPFTLQDCRFDACTVTTAGSGAIAIAGSCFLGGSLSGSPAAPLQLTNSYANATGANVQTTAALPAPQLGRMTISPEDVAIGGTVQFVADLPPGLVGVFALGFTDSTPTLTAPFHLYFEPSSYVMAPGAYLLQQALTWSVPNAPQFVGLDLVAQLAVLPLGVSAPWLQLPPPMRFVLQ